MIIFNFLPSHSLLLDTHFYTTDFSYLALLPIKYLPLLGSEGKFQSPHWWFFRVHPDRNFIKTYVSLFPVPTTNYASEIQRITLPCRTVIFFQKAHCLWLVFDQALCLHVEKLVVHIQFVTISFNASYMHSHFNSLCFPHSYYASSARICIPLFCLSASVLFLPSSSHCLPFCILGN